MSRPNRKPDYVTNAKNWFEEQKLKNTCHIAYNEKDASFIYRLLRAGHNDTYNFTNEKEETEVCEPTHKVEVWYTDEYRYRKALKEVNDLLGTIHDDLNGKEWHVVDECIDLINAAL